MNLERNEDYETCINYFSRMCKVRDKSLRDCVLPRCCGICPKLEECNGICKPIIEGFKLKDIELLKDNEDGHEV